jgi:hypothetical protein
MRPAVVRVALVLCSLALIAPPAALAQAAPPPLALLSPTDERTFDRAQAVTFRVQGQPNEPAGSLRIELSVDDVLYDENGLYDRDDPYYAGTWELQPVEPGSDIYKATVPQSHFAPDDFHSDQTWYWHAYRVLPGGGCDPDCFQETQDRVFYVEDAHPYLADEPHNNTRGDASRLEEVSFGQGFLEARDDRDWYRFRTRNYGPEVRRFTLQFQNLGCNEHCRRIPAGENGDMVVGLYRKGFKQALFKRRVNVGDDVVLRADVRRDTVHFLIVRHAKTRQRAAKDLEYGYWPNNGNGV